LVWGEKNQKAEPFLRGVGGALKYLFLWGGGDSHTSSGDGNTPWGGGLKKRSAPKQKPGAQNGANPTGKKKGFCGDTVVGK